MPVVADEFGPEPSSFRFVGDASTVRALHGAPFKAHVGIVKDVEIPRRIVRHSKLGRHDDDIVTVLVEHQRRFSSQARLSASRRQHANGRTTNEGPCPLPFGDALDLDVDDRNDLEDERADALAKCHDGNLRWWLMTWDAYIEAIITVPGTPRWPQFRVEPRPADHVDDTFPFDESVVFVTACNPGRAVDPLTNACADARLLDAVLHRGLRWFRSVGSDLHGGGAVEPGFGIIGLPLDEGIALGAEFDQDAIYLWSPEALDIITCRPDGKGVRLGWAIVPES